MCIRDSPEYANQIALYDESWAFIASTYITSDTVTFDNLSLEKKPWSHQLYVYLLPIVNDVQTPYPPISFTLSSYWLVAKWAITWSKVTKTWSISTHLVSTVTIAPVAINTVQFVNSWNGYTTNTILTQGQNTLWLLEITSPTNVNTYSRDIIIDQITVTVNDSTTARNVASLLQIERIDNGSNETVFGAVNGNTVTFTLNTNSDLSTLQQWQNAVYRFVATLSLDPSVRESIELTINNLKNGWVVYHSKETPTAITTIQQRDRITTSARIID